MEKVSNQGDVRADDRLEVHGGTLGRRCAAAAATDGGRRELVRLKWLTTLVPAIAVFLFETIRHDFLHRLLPQADGNLLAGLLALGLAYGFSELVFGIVERLQAESLERARGIAALHAMMDERDRLSRELHDGVAQVVAYFLVSVDTVADLVRADRRAEALAELERLREIADDLYVDVREAITGLRAQVAEHGLGRALREYVGAYEERYAIPVELGFDASPEELPVLVQMQLFRIAQEALANVHKHAGAGRVEVRLRLVAPATFELTVADDGRGFGSADVVRPGRGSFGLTTMAERAASLGGSFQVVSETGQGTRVQVTVPLVARSEMRDDTLASSPR